MPDGFDMPKCRAGANTAARKRADGNVIRYQGGGHGADARFGIAGIDAAVDAYLFTLVLPAEGFRCPAQPVRFRP